jgi:hypothetical protein
MKQTGTCAWFWVLLTCALIARAEERVEQTVDTDAVPEGRTRPSDAPSSLQEYPDEASRNNPALQAALQRWNAAREKIPQAGALPVLTSTGRGSDVMVPMAIPSFGGMLIEIMTMRVVPVLYCSIEETKHRFAGRPQSG